MADDFTAMSHENDGGVCWCGPKCGPVQYVPEDHEIRSRADG